MCVSVEGRGTARRTMLGFISLVTTSTGTCICTGTGTGMSFWYSDLRRLFQGIVVQRYCTDNMLYMQDRAVPYRRIGRMVFYEYTSCIRKILAYWYWSYEIVDAKNPGVKTFKFQIVLLRPPSTCNCTAVCMRECTCVSPMTICVMLFTIQ